MENKIKLSNTWGEGYLLLGGEGSPIWGNGRKDIRNLLRMSTTRLRINQLTIEGELRR
ncbi:MAG: hypothetical protein V2A53_01585 [bacterium]